MEILILFNYLPPKELPKSYLSCVSAKNLYVLTVRDANKTDQVIQGIPRTSMSSVLCHSATPNTVKSAHRNIMHIFYTSHIKHCKWNTSQVETNLQTSIFTFLPPANLMKISVSNTVRHSFKAKLNTCITQNLKYHHSSTATCHSIQFTL